MNFKLMDEAFNGDFIILLQVNIFLYKVARKKFLQ